ncbi:speckle-type POZ protein B-like [Planococcus citri]|uniref:speckle-type POZ protein B-like n=1 Tax=Planococcus citri TaxID=170843 RepID=UPI0031F93782
MGENQIIVRNWCSTMPLDSEEDCENFNYLWIIRRYEESFDATNSKISSPEFSTPSNERHKWSMSLHPRSHYDIYKLDFLQLSLKFTCVEADVEVLARFKFSILDSERKIVHGRRSAFRKWKPGKQWFINSFIERDALLERKESLLPDDKLSILCEITVRLPSSSQHEVSNQPRFDIMPIETPSCTLSDDLSQLLEDQEFCDVTLSVNGQQFKAHKNILSARCSVFKAMFKHRMQEANSNRVEITDVKPDVFRELLHYIYTGNVKNTETATFMDLLVAAADKYDLQNLKFLCEDALCKRLSHDNAANILIIADSHQSEKLKAAAISFIKSNAFAVMSTDGWKDVLYHYPNLVCEVKNGNVKSKLKTKEKTK